MTESPTDPGTSLFHIISEQDWASAVEAGQLRPASLDTEGFIHFSRGNQVQATANRFYASIEHLIVVEFDPDKVGLEVVEEDSFATGQSFPHVYGAVPTAAATAQHQLSRTEDGGYEFRY